VDIVTPRRRRRPKKPTVGHRRRSWMKTLLQQIVILSYWIGSPSPVTTQTHSGGTLSTISHKERVATACIGNNLPPDLQLILQKSCTLFLATASPLSREPCLPPTTKELGTSDHMLEKPSPHESQPLDICATMPRHPTCETVTLY